VASETKLSIGFINWAHALDHYVMLIFPTVVIGLEIVYGRSYAELIALGTPAFLAFGVFSLPAGWLGDRWSRRNMIAVFYAGCGLSLVAAALAPNLVVLAVALTALGLFAAIYHPVGTAMLIQHATLRGRSLAFNGVCGNSGAGRQLGMARGLPGARRDLRRQRRRLSAARPGRKTRGGKPRHGSRCSAPRRFGGDHLRAVRRDCALRRPRFQHCLGCAAEDRG
jgi:hypothetical protein